MTTTIRGDDLIQSVADALQYISYYHTPDFLAALDRARRLEESPAAREALAQVLVNARMAAVAKRPICQDTGMALAWLRVGMEVRFDGGRTPQELVDEGVRLAYRSAANPLRASMVRDPAGKRMNTRDNTPAVVHVELVPGNRLEVFLSAKGGGSENKAALLMLNPNEDIVAAVTDLLPSLGAGWCPPGVLGIGIGGNAELALLSARKSLFEPVDIQELAARGPASRAEELRLELYDAVNRLGIGAQGLGGLTTVLDVKVRELPCHAVALPVGVIPNCVANRHIHFALDGSGPAVLPEPSLDDWPEIDWQPAGNARRVDLDTLSKADLAAFQAGETLLLSGTMLTGRDAAHRRIRELLDAGEPLPVDFTNRFIYYVGPVDPVRDEVVGPAGPTTATRMDAYSEMMLARTGILGMIGKAERGPETVETLRRHGSVYLIAVGGAAYLISRAIRRAKVVAFPDLGMEAIYEFEVRDFPVTVAVDIRGHSLHVDGPAAWRGCAIPIHSAS